jgi:2-polyprenyl-3-methyl-5-hydroxy-6-metoxy-1,4-benzoquinol methylase
MMSPRCRSLCRYARKVTLILSEIDEQDIEELRDAGFSDREIVDANGIIAYYNYANRIAAGLGVGAAQQSRVAHLATRYSIDAERYRDLWGPLMLPLSQSLLDSLPLAHAGRVLDLGCGVGSLLEALGRAATHSATVAVDCSVGMLELIPRGHQRAAMDAHKLGISSGSFDVAVLAFMLFHSADPVACLREVRRVLRPGGSVGIVTWGQDLIATVDEIVVAELDLHGASRVAALSTYEVHDTPDKLAELMGAAGFITARSWAEGSDNWSDLRGFADARMSVGQFRLRLETLSGEVRSMCIGAIHRRLAGVQRPSTCSDIVLAVGTSPTRSCAPGH